MADDPTQRPYRSNDTPTRGGNAKPSGASSSGSDPLAELARLIGQNDPFAEYGGAAAAARAPAASSRPPQQPEPDWDTAPADAGYEPPPAAPKARAPMSPPTAQFGAPSFGRQPFGGSPFATGPDLYHVETEAAAGPAAQADAYEDVPYDQSADHAAAEQEDFYEDVHPNRKRMSVMVIAGVFALAVLGTAGAFGYRALFGSSGGSAPPPVIKADSTPSKIVPATNKDQQSAKQITDRVNDRGMGEKLVSREEQPVEIKDKPAGAVFPQGQDPAQASSGQPVLGSGVVGSDAKRVRTIVIHPDQGTSGNADAASAAPAPAAAPVRTAAMPARPAAPPPRVVNNAAAEPEPPVPAPSRQSVARAAPPAQHAAAPAPSANSPLSLSPEAAPARTAPARASAPATRTATAAAPTQIAPAATGGGAGSYAVQVSSQRSEAEAQAAFRSLQGKFPGQLGGKQHLIHRVDLGAKGIYFRAMVGPFASSGEANELCGSLKAAGGQCIVQRN